MSLLSCCHAANAQHCRRHCRCAVATITMLPCLLPPCCCRCCAAVSAIVLPPSCHHCHCHHAATTPAAAAKLPLPPWHHQAAAAAAKLLLLQSSTLWDRFLDDEKELCKMTDVDFFWLSQLFQLGIKFLHGGMLSIFGALVYLSLNYICLQSSQ